MSPKIAAADAAFRVVAWDAVRQERSARPGGKAQAGGSNAPAERVDLYISAEHFNKVLRRCARLLADTIYLRGIAPAVVTHAASA